MSDKALRDCTRSSSSSTSSDRSTTAARPPSDAPASAAQLAQWSRRRFLGTGAALGAAVLCGLDALHTGTQRVGGSGLSTRELAQGASLTFDRSRSRPGHEAELAVEVPALADEPGARAVKVWLLRERTAARGGHTPLAQVEVVLEAGRGRTTLRSPMAELDAEERAREGFLVVAALVADDDRERAVLGARPLEVVVTPFVLGL